MDDRFFYVIARQHFLSHGKKITTRRLNKPLKKMAAMLGSCWLKNNLGARALKMLFQQEEVKKSLMDHYCLNYFQIRTQYYARIFTRITEIFNLFSRSGEFRDGEYDIFLNNRYKNCARALLFGMEANGKY
ncbi:MAG: hypothetical protein KIT27_08530 [Legionellales bacterium]|nr:hypothetical protein [Legionellales bacterium]